MIININLLPWREIKRKKNKRIFLISLLVSALISICAIFLVQWYYSMAMTEQKQRNAFLNAALVTYDQKIKKIQKIKILKKNLTKRMNMIGQLQKERPIVVYIFDVLNDILPAGVYVTEISKNSNVLQLTGKADSNNQISKFMRSINSAKESAWFRGAVLHEIKSAGKKSETRVSDFKLKLTLDPSQAQQDMPSQKNKVVKNGR
jgi:type IV pilus assembly protein PilN